MRTGENCLSHGLTPVGLEDSKEMATIIPPTMTKETYLVRGPCIDCRGGYRGWLWWKSKCPICKGTGIVSLLMDNKGSVLLNCSMPQETKCGQDHPPIHND